MLKLKSFTLLSTRYTLTTIGLYFVTRENDSIVFLFTSFNSLPNNKFLYWTKFKAFADDKFRVAKMMITPFDRTENIVGKGENAGFLHFLLFPQCFQQTSS